MFKKLPVRLQSQFEERLSLFVHNPYHPLLHNHSLSGEWAGCRSIDIAGDLRAVYEELDGDQIELIAVGSHSQLYS